MKKSKKVLLLLSIMMFIPGFVFAAPEDGVITPEVISPTPDVNVIPGDTINTTDGDVLTPDAVLQDAVTPDGDVPPVDSVPSTELTDPITESDTTDTTGKSEEINTPNKEVKTTVVANPIEEEENNDILYMSILGGIVVVTIIAVVALYKKSAQA